MKVLIGKYDKGLHMEVVVTEREKGDDSKTAVNQDNGSNV
jgi:hypothetical protein